MNAGRVIPMQVIMRDSVTRRKMFFVPAVDNWDPAWADDIQSNGRWDQLVPIGSN
jgi:hypothetical protein